MEDQLFSSQNLDLNNHLALCIDNNDNQMTFVRHILYLWLRLGANDATRATNKLYIMPSKIHVIVQL